MAIINNWRCVLFLNFVYLITYLHIFIFTQKCTCIINANILLMQCACLMPFFFFLFKKIKAVSFYNKLNIDFPSFLNKSFNFSSNRVCGESSTVFWSVSSSRFDSLHLLVFWAGAELNLLNICISMRIFFSLNIILLFQWFLKRFGILYKTFFFIQMSV